MILASAGIMSVVLILVSVLSAPPPGCAALAYCLAEARQAFCEIHGDGLPAKLTAEERPVHALAARMEAEGCAVPDDRLACPAPAPARVAPPVDCGAVVEDARR